MTIPEDVRLELELAWAVAAVAWDEVARYSGSRVAKVRASKCLTRARLYAKKPRVKRQGRKKTR